MFEHHTVWDNLLLAAKAPRGAFATLCGARSRRESASDRGDPGDHPPQRPARSGAPASCRTARSNGWRSACCWRRSRKLLLVDEPVAGMTDAETEQTAELLREITADHAVVVVEHDMAFVRALGVKVTVLHEGSVLAEGSIDHVSDDPRVIEVYLGR